MSGYLLVKMTDVDGFDIVRRRQDVGIEIVARSSRLSAMVESDEVRAELDTEAIADIHAAHAVAEEKFGTSDLKLVRAAPAVLPFGQPGEMVKPHVVVWGSDELDDDDADTCLDTRAPTDL